MRRLSATMSAKTTLWMCVALAAAILAAWLVVVLATPTKRAEAAFPGNNGKIAFICQAGNTDQEICTMKANGDNKTQLTNDKEFDGSPTFSANGKKIAFAASDGSANIGIYTMSANGTNEKRVTRSESPDLDPAWAPDGSRIAFASPRHGNLDIYVINQDGSGLTRLTTSPKPDAKPAWSPDGTRIAFRRDGKIYVMKAARESQTNRPRRLTTSGERFGAPVSESDPTWSPNGNKIAFVSTLKATQEGDSHIYSIRADGSHQIRLTFSFGDRQPAWSPDGNKIAFVRFGRRDLSREIYIMNAAPESETNRPKRLTDNRILDWAPDWQPLP